MALNPETKARYAEISAKPNEQRTPEERRFLTSVFTHELQTGMENASLPMQTGLCPCLKKQMDRDREKREELLNKYPPRNCGEFPTAECSAYNDQMVQHRDQEFKAWKENADAQVSDELSATERDQFAMVSILARDYLANNPEDGNKTLKEIYKENPEEFEESYKRLGKIFPVFKSIDPATALAMSPEIANMSLNEIISRTTTMGGLSSSMIASRSSLMIGAGMAGLALLWLLKRKD